MPSNLTADLIAQQIKPLSANSFVAFFQRMYRWWIGIWSDFTTKHPKFSKLLYMVVFFFIFSMAVTVWQFIIMTFMPYLFGDLNQQAFVWPALEIPGWFAPDGTQLYYAIFNEPAAAAGGLGGLGNFIAFEIAVFTAQCINFPLQRNITFKSHGNIPWQIMWYFIGWVGISIFVNAVWGIAGPILSYWGLGNVIPWHITVVGLVKTFITGGVSMIIFFFIFLIIFPDYTAVAKRTQKALDKLIASNASAEKIEKAREKNRVATIKARLSTAEKAEAKAIGQSSVKAIAYSALVKKSAKLAADVKAATDETRKEKLLLAKNEIDARIPGAFEKCGVAIDEKEFAIKDYQIAILEAGPITLGKQKA